VEKRRRGLGRIAPAIAIVTLAMTTAISAPSRADAQPPVCYVQSVVATNGSTGDAIMTSMVPSQIVPPGTVVQVRVEMDPLSRGCNGVLEARIDPVGIRLTDPWSMGSISYEFTVPEGLTPGVEYAMTITTPSSFFHPEDGSVHIASVPFRTAEAPTGASVEILPPTDTSRQGAGDQQAVAPAAPVAPAPAEPAPVSAQAPADSAGAAPAPEDPASAPVGPPQADAIAVTTASAQTQAQLPDWVWLGLGGLVALAAVGGVVGRLVHLRRRRLADARLAQRG
jgi:hypothetical protein